ncbi:hypothetical protein [Actinomycetospora cinnamomea]|uniref:Cupin 2 conserved barrel domain-containing protein n=1 Tax=Actinomycetospora cinnamomea TaxID=663609 RepID=A0A2U1FAG0_9PSEU|nr:hypothetical protein [Actinomycetospora cinnamomea]PVZ09129.1 hypothetical protein C8D89_107293 [Actinomycetospora cinnamomea]
MSKVSKATASSHQVFPGLVDAYEQEIGGWTVSIESHFTDMDVAPFFEGAPNDQCQATHMGYILKGKFGVRRADGIEEIFEAGDAFVLEAGHIPIVFAGCEYVAFTPTEEARQQTAVMMPNIMKFAKERGIELPGQ